MKKLTRIITRLLLGTIGILFIIVVGFYGYRYIKARNNYALLKAEAPVIKRNGVRYRDLNKNNRIDIYEDPASSPEERVEDLLGQMTLEEKAGCMFITMIGMTDEGKPIDTPPFSLDPVNSLFGVVMPQSSELIARKLMNSFNIIHSYDAKTLATFNNTIQKLAERTRLGIPVTIATDPRHGTPDNPGASVYTPSFSQWPTAPGLAATRDTLLVREFGDIARQEYKAVGIRLALHPMADLATEPRWGRVNGTFGEDAHLSAIMTRAYVLGFQGNSLGHHSVACMTKHFSGGGPQKDGEDAHFPYGREQVYPGKNFDYHLIPFTEGAFPAKTAQIMPYYGIPVDQTNENVAFAFNREIITGLLRDSLRFDGVVCTDWNIINDSGVGPVRAWGVESLTPLERTRKVLEAGCDQFGGESSPELIIQLVRSGQITEERIDQSVRRILRDKFRLGLFDDPYVNIQNAEKIAGNERFKAKGKRAQAKSTVLLKNNDLLPLKQKTKVYQEGMNNPGVLRTYGELVGSPEEADVIVLRLRTPFEPRNEYFLEGFFHQGRLYYETAEESAILALAQQKPTIVVVNLERPAILTRVSENAAALMVEFGTSDEVLTQLLFGEATPEGRLPFELPSNWEAVQQQLEDVPYDSENPLYPFGFGLESFGGTKY